MSFFDSVVSMGKAAIQRIQLQAQTDPNAVKAANANDFVRVATVDRNGCCVLYGPRSCRDRDGNHELYEVVVNTLNGASFVVFRGIDDLAAAQSTFDRIKDKLPVLLDLDASLGSQANLQMLCDALRANPSLSALHLAVQFDLRSVVKSDELVASLLHRRDMNGETALMTAVKKENLYMVRLLVAKKADVEAVEDVAGNSLLHLAANTNKDMVEAVVTESMSAEAMNRRNKEGDTPLHVACKNDKPDCVKALLCAGNDSEEKLRLLY